MKRAASDTGPDGKAAKQGALGDLKGMTSVVADTGDFEKIKEFRPEDATTNPSLLFQACGMPAYAAVVDAAIKDGKATGKKGDELVEEIIDQLNVSFGCKILEVVPGYVSTEVDAMLSFDKVGSIARAKKLIAMYEARGISRNRILIKLGSTWEGIEACRQLEMEGIRCNMTLLFSFAQALACAQAGATLISPFVGRITDWYKKSTGTAEYAPDEDPGVVSVRRIFNYYKKYGHKTIVMGASFRNKGQILGLAGCDKLTIAPKLLGELKDLNEKVALKLDAKHPKCDEPKIVVDEATFRWMHNEDAMATEKLAEGIRGFHKDADKLRALLKQKLA